MYTITPQTKPFEPWAWWDDAFTSEELDQLEALAASSTDPGVVGANELNPDIRRSNVTWLKSPEHEWVFARLANVVAINNARYWQLDLTGFGEDLQLSRYSSDNQGCYDWHQDFGGGISRKLSLAVQLTDPDKYDGGHFEFMLGKNPVRVEKKRGRVVLFPSFQLHRVTPVYDGARHSLVAWVSGVPFR